QRDQRGRPLGVRRGEENAHVSTLGVAEQRGTLRTDRLEHGADVVHALLEGRQLVVGDAVGESCAALVEEDEAREGGEALEEVRHRRLLPHQLDVRDPARNVDEVARPLARHLIGDVEIAAPRVPGPGPDGRGAAYSRHSPGTPLRSWTPRSSNSSPDPATRSLTVLDTSTSPGPACAATRAPVWTAMPEILPSTS